MRVFLARSALELAVFVCGALVMVYEIIGSRIVAPYIGTSTYIWTSLIGVILAALSLGYWIGGRMADKRPEIKILAAAIFMAGGLVSLTILIKDVVLSAIHAAGGPLELKAVGAAALLFAPASVMLGFVTPYAVKLRTLSLNESGKTVGRLYALSTVGSIAGTFAAGFFLIPFVGSTRTLYLIAGSLFAVSLLLAPFALTRTNLTILIVFVFGMTGSEVSAWYMRTVHGVIDLDTEYSRVQIFETTHAETGRPYRAIATDPYFAQSAIYLDDGSPVFEYVKFFKLVDHFNPGNKKVLMIGGAGYTIPREYLKDHPDSTIDVVEIDPQMTQLARQYFGLKDDPRMKIFHQDGRVFLNNAPSNTYDAVFIDAFGSLFSIPWQLTTLEAVQHVHRVLKHEGVVIVNIGGALESDSSRFLASETSTFRKAFSEVLLFKVRPDRSDSDLQNIALVGCKVGCHPFLPGNRVVPPLENLREGNFGDAQTLTDELAPVEHFNSFALKQFGPIGR
ncbi:MAG: fused MFS/spermidine synthase [Pyrinomonadaceae bacterium]